MIGHLLLAALALTALSGVPGLFTRKDGAAGDRIAAALMALGSLSGIAAAALVLGGGRVDLDAPWPVPGGRLALSVDAVSAMFLIQIFLIAALGSIYGTSYWRAKDHPGDARKLRLSYGVLTAGLALVVVAANGVLFLLAWEVMAISGFFTITTEDGQPAVRESGFLYLVATRLSSLCLFAFFALLHAATGSFAFGPQAAAAIDPGTATALFLLAIVGFGLKAGIMPLHVWLPGAHANAPSHVSAIMSGVLLKMGIYGLVRVTALFPSPPLWWGGLLLGLGATSGILGVAFAIGQHDVKRLLAYHSVENIGIIVMGLGLAVLGRSIGAPALVALGMAGALLHVWNHGLFKALLFLSAGAVVHATGTREIDRLGGLSKRMPLTSLAFLVGAVAISGLPPLNGFVSEYLLYAGMFRATAIHEGRAWLLAAFAAPALALIGGLAVACFVKVFGAIFLGEPRTPLTRGAHDPGPAMLWPMAALAACCALIGLAPAAAAPALDAATAAWTGAAARPIGALVPLGWITWAELFLLVLVAAGALILRRPTSQREDPPVGTWDCGYAAPASSMQYTSSSFAELLVGTFGWALRPRVHAPALRAPFPGPSRFHGEVPDTVLDRFVLPISTAAARVFRWFRWVQQGNVHAYILYVLVALIVSFLWWR